MILFRFLYLPQITTSTAENFKWSVRWIIRLCVAKLCFITCADLLKTQITQNLLNMEFALEYGIWASLRLEKIPETHILATVLAENAWLFNEKRSLA